MPSLSAQQTLAIWEQGVRRHPVDRALLLFSLARPDLDSGSLADYPLGTRNATLMKLQADIFRSRLAAWLDCSSCGERLEFEMDQSQLPPLNSASKQALHIAGIEFDLPTSRHLSDIALHCDDFESATRQLLLSCAHAEADLPQDSESLEKLLQQVENAMEEADPWAHVTVSVQCPGCGQDDTADFDIAEYLWHEIDARTQRLLNDIHVLASHYGWNEDEILQLSEQRRAAYLGRVLAGNTDTGSTGNGLDS